jgi:hypothetical protein
MAQPQTNPRQKDIARLLRQQQNLKGDRFKSMRPNKLQAAFMKKGGR